MAKMMLYNGVEFPELPVYDESTYRYALIVGESLYMFEVEPVVSGVMASVTSEACGYYVRNNTWVQNTFPTLSQTWNFSKENIVWVNFNLLNSDGTIYLAASTPVDPNAPTFAPADFLRWFSLGQAAGLKLKPTGDPAAYLYNGVQMPDINTVWIDKNKYPSALLLQYSAGRLYYLVLYSCEIRVSGTTTLVTTPGISVSYMIDLSSSSSWTKTTENNEESGKNFYPPNLMFWSSSDILRTDETVYLRKSDPIPVYE